MELCDGLLINVLNIHFHFVFKGRKNKQMLPDELPNGITKWPMIHFRLPSKKDSWVLRKLF